MDDNGRDGNGFDIYNKCYCNNDNDNDTKNMNASAENNFDVDDMTMTMMTVPSVEINPSARGREHS